MPRNEFSAHLKWVITGVDWGAMNDAIGGMADMVGARFGGMISAFQDQLHDFMQQELSARDVLIVSGVMVAVGVIIMPVCPVIGAGLVNSGMTTGMTAINALFTNQSLTMGSVLKTGVSAFAAGMAGGAITQGLMAIGAEGIMVPIASALGDMATDATYQYIMTGKVDKKEVIVSGLTSFVTSGGLREAAGAASGIGSKADDMAYAGARAGKTVQSSTESFGSAASGYADDGARDIGGLRQSAHRELNSDEINYIKNEFSEIGGDPSKLRFNKGSSTSYRDDIDMINIRGDVFPDVNDIHPRSVMSERAVLAHEYYGHAANRGTTARIGSWNDEFRASYMAAKNAPNLSEMDKYHLIQDAVSRAQEAGVSIRPNEFMRSILYGY